MTRIAKTFSRKKTVFASLVRNAELTPVTFEYERDKTIMSGLGEDLPPFVRIWKSGKIEGSLNRISWLEFGPDATCELQIYRLFDPVSVLPRVRISGPTEEPLSIVEGSYEIADLDLPSSLFEYFKEEKSLSRWIRLRVFKDDLLSMSQQDFPPYSDTITLVFSDWVRPWLPLFF
jgi:hypothetical protein